MCLLLGIPRALAMASVSKDGSRAIRAPWIPLPWRLSAYSWKAQHKGSGEKSSQTWSTDWGYWKLRTGSISHHGSSKTLFSHSSMYIQVPPPPFLQHWRGNQSNKAIIIFVGVLLWWYLVAIWPRNLHSRGEYRHWPPTHLEVYVSDPLHYSVTCPNNGVPVLVLTSDPPCLQGLQTTQHTDNCARTNVAQREVREGRGACWDNVCLKLRCIIMDITFSFVSVVE